MAAERAAEKAEVKRVRTVASTKNYVAPQTPHYCCNSRHNHATVARMKGNGWIEAVLYLFYLVPGISYSIWRRSG